MAAEQLRFMFMVAGERAAQVPVGAEAADQEIHGRPVRKLGRVRADSQRSFHGQGSASGIVDAEAVAGEARLPQRMGQHHAGFAVVNRPERQARQRHGKARVGDLPQLLVHMAGCGFHRSRIAVGPFQSIEVPASGGQRQRDAQFDGPLLLAGTVDQGRLCPQKTCRIRAE